MSMPKFKSDSRVLSRMLIDGTLKIANDPKCEANNHREIYLNSTYRLIEDIKYSTFTNLSYIYKHDSIGNEDLEPSFDLSIGRLSREEACIKLQRILTKLYNESATATDKKYLIRVLSKFSDKLKLAKDFGLVA